MRVAAVNVEAMVMAVVVAMAVAEVIIQRLILLLRGCLQNSNLEVQH